MSKNISVYSHDSCSDSHTCFCTSCIGFFPESKVKRWCEISSFQSPHQVHEQFLDPVVVFHQLGSGDTLALLVPLNGKSDDDLFGTSIGFFVWGVLEGARQVVVPLASLTVELVVIITCLLRAKTCLLSFNNVTLVSYTLSGNNDPVDPLVPLLQLTFNLGSSCVG